MQALVEAFAAHGLKLDFDDCNLNENDCEPCPFDIEHVDTKLNVASLMPFWRVLAGDHGYHYDDDDEMDYIESEWSESKRKPEYWKAQFERCADLKTAMDEARLWMTEPPSKICAEFVYRGMYVGREIDDPGIEPDNVKRYRNNPNERAALRRVIAILEERRFLHKKTRYCAFLEHEADPEAAKLLAVREYVNANPSEMMQRMAEVPPRLRGMIGPNGYTPLKKSERLPQGTKSPIYHEDFDSENGCDDEEFY